MDGNRLHGGSAARRGDTVTQEQQQEETVSRELIQEYMLKAPQQVQIGVAS